MIRTRLLSRARRRLLACLLLVCGSQLIAASQDRPAGDPPLAVAVPAGQSAMLIFANREITRLRASVLTRPPDERVQAAAALLDQLVENNVSGPVETQLAAGVAFVRVGGRNVFAIVPADLDTLADETLDGKAGEAAARLRVALAEAIEIRTPGRVLWAIVRVLAATVLLGIAAAILRRGQRWTRRSLTSATERGLEHLLPNPIVNQASGLIAQLPRVMAAVTMMGLGLLLLYAWTTFTLRQFPYTRVWGETLARHLVVLLKSLVLDVAHAVPGLIVVAIVFAVARLIVRISSEFFYQVERGVVQASWVHQETASATRRLVSLLIWLFAIVIAYPYVPGSGSDAFKGLSVFLGVVISLGSSGIVNQLMSGLTLTYSRALKIGELVKVGDHEGMVTGMNMLTVKLRTFQGEEVTVPNAVVVGQSTTNYTRLAASGGTFLATSVTIGYDTPWRQVKAMLLLAAGRTPNIRPEPAPRVLQDSLDDFYVAYRLLVCLDDPNNRLVTRDLLNANIQDVFNEFGAQIMSPHYESDPAAAKVVPRARWHEAPAPPESK